MYTEITKISNASKNVYISQALWKYLNSQLSIVLINLWCIISFDIHTYYMLKVTNDILVHLFFTKYTIAINIL